MQNLQDLVNTVASNVGDVKKYCSKDMYEQVLDTLLNTLLDLCSDDVKDCLVESAKTMVDVNKYCSSWNSELSNLNDHILYWATNDLVELSLTDIGNLE